MNDGRTRFDDLLDGTVRSPARENAGLTWGRHGPGRLAERMAVPGWLRSERDVTPAVLVLADSVAAGVVNTRLAPDRVPLSRRLHVELYDRAAASTSELHGEAWVVDERARAATVLGVVRAGGCVVATMCLRASIVGGAGHAAPAHAVPSSPGGAIGIECIADAAADGRYRAAVHDGHANSAGTLHGGVLLALAGHTATMEVDRNHAGASMCGIDIDFLRGVPTPATIELHASVDAAGGDAPSVAVQVHDERGEVAARVRATYRPLPSAI